MADCLGLYTIEAPVDQSQGIASLFAYGSDPIVVIRWKDVFERRDPIDATGRAAYIVDGIAIKSS